MQTAGVPWCHFINSFDKLIETAVKGGGHRKAMVYYFYNCPDNFVYKNSNLTDPIKLTQLYSMIRADHTNALIISDAGAARGNMNEMRVEKTKRFLCGEEGAVNSLDGLHKQLYLLHGLTRCHATGGKIAPQKQLKKNVIQQCTRLWKMVTAIFYMSLKN